MLIRNKYFPYPVVAKGNDSYATATFSSDVEIERVGYQIKFTLKANTDNNGLNDLIKAQKASIVHHIECVQTCYRHAVSTDDNETTFLIHENKLNGAVQVTTVIVAKEDITGYKNADFSLNFSQSILILWSRTVLSSTHLLLNSFPIIIFLAIPKLVLSSSAIRYCFLRSSTFPFLFPSIRARNFPFLSIRASPRELFAHFPISAGLIPSLPKAIIPSRL